MVLLKCSNLIALKYAYRIPRGRKLYNRCREFRCIHSAWKRAMTVLIHKKGDPADPGNWRPIALCSTIAKLYTICLAAHIAD
ncbi:hypothetical protein Y1Q_0012473 [Alligator mississippiensis]|uniref:Uncharacterized protein n=1 Tax=Alligator mississippiensis TaxID=8496 RepID=A0A151M7R6_ALLMI|nr:hypothetical protein Y1Q_0012473 [Alligator mississippiensis]